MSRTHSGYSQRRTTVYGVELDIVEGGSGRPMLFLHSVDGVPADSPFFDLLGEDFAVTAPWHPGFGHSELPRDVRSIGDLALFYLQLIDELQLSDFVLVGSSFGGWLAAEIAVRTCQPLSHLVLLDPLGIKVGDRETRDITDMYAIPQDELTRLAYHDPRNRERDYSTMSDHELVGIARSRETYTNLGWKPYMHTPSLRYWLGRIRRPTLVVWGESDGIVTPDYGRAYAEAIPAARFEVVPEAGHYPHIEQPHRVATLVREFVHTTDASVGLPHATATA